MSLREPIPINATDLRYRHREVMERVKYHGEVFLVKTFGQPTAIIVSIDEFYRMQRAGMQEFTLADRTPVADSGNDQTDLPSNTKASQEPDPNVPGSL